MRQARWKESVSNIVFTHSSQKAWHNINKLTGRNSTKAKYHLPPNAIAKQVVANRILMERDKTFTREVNREVSHIKMRPLLPKQEHLSLDFSTHEIKEASLMLKPGKAPGPDGIHNECLTHLDPKLPKLVTGFYIGGQVNAKR